VASVLPRLLFREVSGWMIPSQIKLAEIQIEGTASSIFTPGARVQRSHTITKQGFGDVLHPRNVTDSSQNLLTALIPL
jgi:hypothetical protein